MSMVYLIGAGPGDPELITVKGMELLKQCDAVIYDRLGTYQLLEYVPEHCEKIYVGKQAGAHYKKQSEINEILIKAAREHEIVVRLKGGDPFVFGRGGEEAEVLLKEGIPFKLVPGITSAIAVPETLGIPVTHRKVARSFHVITGHTMEDELSHIQNLEGTSVFLMGLSHLEEIVTRLAKQGKGKTTPVAVISNGTLPGEQIVRGTLETIVTLTKEAKLESPAIIVVGETAGYDFYSSKTGPLTGRHIGVVGTRPLYTKLKNRLEQSGGKAYCLCDMKVVLTKQIEELEEKVSHIEDYAWIGFTSQNAISIFFEELRNWKIDLRRLSDIRFAVVGSGTKQALEKYGFSADFMPGQYTTEAMAKELSTVMKEGERLLLPRARQGSVRMLEILDESHISYDAIPIYDVVGKHTENMEYLPDLDSILFVSASGVEGFFEYEESKDTVSSECRLAEHKKSYDKDALVNSIKENHVQIACLGEVTEKALKKYGLHADILPDVNDVEGLIQAVERKLEH